MCWENRDASVCPRVEVVTVHRDLQQGRELELAPCTATRPWTVLAARVGTVGLSLRGESRTYKRSSPKS